MMEQEYNAEVGRELGWDLARFGWGPRDDANEDIRDGHKAGVAHFGKVHRQPDRFERKWLQLRQNALRRGRVVQPEVTPDFIRAIDHPICPVTGDKMTHGLMTDTDWSVDRVNNNGAYAEGNLVVMCTRANRAKADKTFEEVSHIASTVTDDAEFEGLTTRQWSRLASIMVGVCASRCDKLAMKFPLLTRVPAGSVACDFQLLQWLLYRTTHKASIRSQFVKRFNKLQPDRSTALLLGVAAERLASLVKNLDDMFEASLDSRFNTLLAKWHLAIPDSRQEEYLNLLARIDKAEVVGADMVRKWSLETKGYFSDTSF